MQNILLSMILLFLLSACGDNKQQATHTTQLTQKVNAEKTALLAEIKAKDEALQKARLEAKVAQEKLLIQEQAQKEKSLKQTKPNDKLSKVGIQIKENIITIDTNKTKDFFKTIGDKLRDKVKKITGELEKGMFDEKDAGIKIDDSHINIDFNKTKDFLETWGKKMQGFVKEFDDMAKEIDINTKPPVQ